MIRENQALKHQLWFEESPNFRIPDFSIDNIILTHIKLFVVQIFFSLKLFKRVWFEMNLLYVYMGSGEKETDWRSNSEFIIKGQFGEIYSALPLSNMDIFLPYPKHLHSKSKLRGFHFKHFLMRNLSVLLDASGP